MERGCLLCSGPGGTQPESSIIARRGFCADPFTQPQGSYLAQYTRCKSASRELVPLCVRAGALLYRTYVFSWRGIKTRLHLKF